MTKLSEDKSQKYLAGQINPGPKNSEYRLFLSSRKTFMKGSNHLLGRKVISTDFRELITY